MATPRTKAWATNAEVRVSEPYTPDEYEEQKRPSRSLPFHLDLANRIHNGEITDEEARRLIVTQARLDAERAAQRTVTRGLAVLNDAKALTAQALREAARDADR